MTTQLKRYHGHGQLTKHNAWKHFEDLSSLKDDRMKRKRKPESQNEPASKQAKLENCFAQKYAKGHPRQNDITNTIASMICVDAQLTNIV